VVKQGEYGAALFSDEDDGFFALPAYPLEKVVDPTGAGDSFAGGFLGHIAHRNKTDFATMKEAVIYGNVMGSFAVEDFGVKRLLGITKDDVEERYRKYRNLVQF
jgi:sugar/nucleoside kinase (ribokinase family)